jgi:hypothetical protein
MVEELNYDGRQVGTLVMALTEAGEVVAAAKRQVRPPRSP